MGFLVAPGVGFEPVQNKLAGCRISLVGVGGLTRNLLEVRFHSLVPRVPILALWGAGLRGVGALTRVSSG